MATIYVDWVSGNDTTGDGSAGAPYKLISKALGIAGGPHDIRVAKTTVPTVISSANCTFTIDSITVNTSASLVGTIAVGDHIGLTTAHGNGVSSKTDVDTYYRVTAVAAATITLETKYMGATTTVASINKLNPITQDITTTISTAGTTISGGWNLTTELQDGETWGKTTNRATYVQLTTGATGITISKMNYCNGFQPLKINNDGCIFEYCTVLSCTSTNYYFAGGKNVAANYCMGCGNTTANPIYYAYITGTAEEPATLNYCVGGNSVAGAKVFGSAHASTNVKLTNCAAYASITGFGSTTTLTVGTGHIIMEDCDAYYCFAGFAHATNATNQLICKNCNAYYCTNGFGGGATYYGFATIELYSCGAYDCTYGVYGRAGDHFFKDCIFENCTYGYYVSNYQTSSTLIGCSFVTPVTAGIGREGILSPPIYLYGCSIDAASLAKAYLLTPYAKRYNNALYYLQNSFGVSGKIYSYGAVTADYINVRVPGTTPSLKIQRDNTEWEPSNEVICKIYVNSGTTKTITIYLKADASTSGTYTPTLRLNGVLKKTFTAVTAFPTDWTEYTYTTDVGDIDEDGSLELWFEDIEINNKNIWVDSISIADA
jgi:hypothetical protein